MFVQFIDEMTEQSDSPLLLFTIDSNQISNHILYLTAYRMIHMKMTPQKAYSPFSKLAHQIQPYYDSSSKTHPFPVPIIECAKGVWKAIELNWYSYSSFDVEETRRLERVDEGDMNWLIPGKLLGFASPFPVNNVLGGFKVATPDALVPIFKSFGITSIVRLCKRTYDENIFKSNGFQHYEMFFPDCGVPSVSIRNRFLNIVQKHNEVIGLHCKAGLGRTGTLAACYLIKSFNFEAEEAIGYIRICRPGSIVACQQKYLQQFYASIKAEKKGIAPLSKPSIIKPHIVRKKKQIEHENTTETSQESQAIPFVMPSGPIKPPKKLRKMIKYQRNEVKLVKE